MEDLKNLKFLAVNLKVEEKGDSYRQQHSYAGTIIGATALYIPFFLGSFDATSKLIQVLAVFPTAFFYLLHIIDVEYFQNQTVGPGLQCK